MMTSTTEQRTDRLAALRHSAYRIRRNALSFADEVADRGRDVADRVADRGRRAYNRLTSNRPDPLDELRAVAAFAVGAAALIGVGYLITRVVRRRRAQSTLSPQRRPMGASEGGRLEEPTHPLLSRLDTPEAIERHNERVRQMHENAGPPRERESDPAAH